MLVQISEFQAGDSKALRDVVSQFGDVDFSINADRKSLAVEVPVSPDDVASALGLFQEHFGVSRVVRLT